MRIAVTNKIKGKNLVKQDVIEPPVVQMKDEGICGLPRVGGIEQIQKRCWNEERGKILSHYEKAFNFDYLL